LSPNQIFEKNKIKLRKVSKNDLKKIRDWRNSPEIWNYNSQYILLNMIHQKDWYTSISVKNSERKMFIIESKNGVPIGICGLINLDYEQKKGEVAIILGEKKFHGKRIGTEILRLLLEYGFKKLKLHRISAGIFEYNIISIKLFERLNFKYELSLKQKLWRKNRWWDVSIYSILENEFFSKSFTIR